MFTINDQSTSLAEKLHAELKLVSVKCCARFTGTSVAVCSSLDDIPYYPMNAGWPVDNISSLHDSLLSLGDEASPYHDGFHLLSTQLKFTHVSCFMAPQIQPGAPKIPFAGRGSRFATAYFTSLIPNVVCVGIVSSKYQVTVFKQGAIFQVCDQANIPSLSSCSRTGLTMGFMS
ncbi:MAG: hypothetical protein ABW044_03870 [Cellvibrio sp.]